MKPLPREVLFEGLASERDETDEVVVPIPLSVVVAALGVFQFGVDIAYVEACTALVRLFKGTSEPFPRNTTDRSIASLTGVKFSWLMTNSFTVGLPLFLSTL